MQTPITQRKPKARTLTADSKLPYPKSANPFDSNTVDCWLRVWVCDAARAEEVKKMRFKGSALRSSAIFHSWLALKKDANDSMKNLVDAGGLLFAWAGTTHPAVQS